MNTPLQGNARKAVLHAVDQGTCLAYTVIITPPKMVSALEHTNVISSCIKQVINTHSTGDGTLRASAQTRIIQLQSFRSRRMPRGATARLRKVLFQKLIGPKKPLSLLTSKRRDTPLRNGLQTKPKGLQN